MSNTLTDTTVVITGAGAGQGRSGALLFARNGARLALCDINTNALQQTVELVRAESDVEILSQTRDLRIPAEINAFADAATNQYGVIDTLYNNVGVTMVRSIEDTTAQAWDDLFDINVKAGYFLAKRLLPALRRSSGASIVNVSSGAGIQAPIDDNTVYCATKGAVIALTRAQARDLAPDGIRVNCLIPGPIETALVTDYLAALPRDQSEAKRATFTSRTLLERFGSPDEVAATAVFLAGAAASYITGAIIPVDGGWSAA